MRPPGSPHELRRRRSRAIELLHEGYTPVDVARMIGTDRRSVRRWKAAYRKLGQAGLDPRPTPGRPSRLRAAQMRALERHLLRGAKAAGFPTDLWSCPRVAEVIAQRFGIRYHVDHVCRLLHALGWSPQKPARRALERDEAQIQHWVRHTWTAVKKTPVD